MRILVISDLPHFVTGGAEMQAARLIEAWLDAGHEVTCAGMHMGPGPIAIGRHQIEVVRIRTITVFGRWGRAISYFVSLCTILLRYRRWMDIVYTRFLGEGAATAALLKSLGVLHVPVIATPANTRGDGDTRKLQSLLFGRPLVRCLDRHLDAINLIADDMANELRAAGFSGRNFTHIPNGIPITATPELRTVVPVSFIAVGRLTPQKGYDILLQALARLHTPLEAGQVRIIGDGPERERLQAMASELQIGCIVDWQGELSQKLVKERLDEARVFLLPSRYEGMSNAGLEAMERALPILASRCGGLDHFIDDDIGWVVPPGDIDALAHALELALAAGPSRLTEMGAAARRCIIQNFDMHVVAARYLALFDELRAPSAKSPSDE